MKSDIIWVDNLGSGYDKAIQETNKVIVYRELSEQNAVQLRILAEETLSLARSVTGEMQANFSIEATGNVYKLILTTKAVMDKEKRQALLQSATSRKNEAANSFIGKLRDRFEQAMASEVNHVEQQIPYEVLADIPSISIEDPEWDGFERSVLRRLADNVKIAIRGEQVEMTVTKTFAE